MKSYLSIAMFLIFFSYTAGQGNGNSDDYCTTVNEEYLEGACIPLGDCPQLLPKIRKSRKERESLKAWHCGFDGFVSKVCCPPLGTTTLPPTPHNRCKTASGNTGTCVSIKFCPKLDNMMTSILTDFDQTDVTSLKKMNHLAKSSCPGSLNSEMMHVCCEIEDLSGPYG